MNHLTTLPPRIHYHARPEHYREMIVAAADNVRLSSRATTLLLFYASQSYGFAPALKLIERETGIRSDNVSLVRLDLIKHNLITYDRIQHTIFIHFDHIQAFSMIAHTSGKRLTKAESKNVEYFLNPFGRMPRSETIGSIIRKYPPTPLPRLLHEDPPPPLSPYMKDWIQRAERMTENEYSIMVKSCPQYDPSVQKEMIPWEPYVPDYPSFLATYYRPDDFSQTSSLDSPLAASGTFDFSGEDDIMESA
ncbi:MAG: hypothetical protein IJO02_07875 [Clostridia bacterium]|nr:hypothetical protein [Clostridia bacterium]MBQ6859331.1 hypothetical protein [Clostridia bacterium]